MDFTNKKYESRFNIIWVVHFEYQEVSLYLGEGLTGKPSSPQFLHFSYSSPTSGTTPTITTTRTLSYRLWTVEVETLQTIFKLEIKSSSKLWPWIFVDNLMDSSEFSTVLLKITNGLARWLGWERPFVANSDDLNSVLRTSMVEEENISPKLSSDPHTK